MPDALAHNDCRDKVPFRGGKKEAVAAKKEACRAPLPATSSSELQGNEPGAARADAQLLLLSQYTSRRYRRRAIISSTFSLPSTAINASCTAVLIPVALPHTYTVAPSFTHFRTVSASRSMTC